MRSKKLSIKIITLFPSFIENFVESFGIVKRAIKLGLLQIQPINLRSFGLGERQVVDDRPYGGGVGMVLRADILYKAIKSVSDHRGRIISAPTQARIILLTPQGQKFDQKMAQRLAKFNELIFVCGRYEGFDERVRSFVDEEISIGDYVLMGGELPALVISEAVMRLRSGILGKDESADKESFSENSLEFPQYTKPEILMIPALGRGGSRPVPTKRRKILKVPKVLLSGHHANIEKWRMDEAMKRTKKRRPDLLNNQ
ncbi:MAG: tRNA (guanosine(37)-N1)-methyltransferase TrmD [Candidatus Doudnabacteria bacterium]|nr:tRNA (guanosine(37)-N1)-methyltransferase TrmD [Candidatus Doudnabacteria bacterium]